MIHCLVCLFTNGWFRMVSLHRMQRRVSVINCCRALASKSQALLRCWPALQRCAHWQQGCWAVGPYSCSGHIIGSTRCLMQAFLEFWRCRFGCGIVRWQCIFCWWVTVQSITNGRSLCSALTFAVGTERQTREPASFSNARRSWWFNVFLRLAGLWQHVGFRAPNLEQWFCFNGF